jgi:hypothetical protein
MQPSHSMLKMTFLQDGQLPRLDASHANEIWWRGMVHQLELLVHQGPVSAALNSA